MKDDDWTCQIGGDIKSRKQNHLIMSFCGAVCDRVCVCTECVCVRARLNVCAFVDVCVCVFVFTPVGSVIFAPNYLRHKSTVGALPWQPAVGWVLVMVA